MIFTTLPFFFFLLVVLGIYWALPSDRFRHPFLFGANFFFYGWWNWKFTALLFIVILISYGAGRFLEQAETQFKKRIMFGACALLLGILGYFKYTNFFLESIHLAFEKIGGTLGWTTLKIILPAGISFYIFQAISYVVTVYRQKLAAETSFVRLGVYLSFFPHLVAGPIIHAPTFLPQLREKRHFDSTFFIEGCRKFALGFLYKAVFADHLAAVVNPIFQAVEKQQALTLFGGCLGFYGQIYFDFAGYSLMAIGVAQLLGYTLPENFHFPYRATSLIDFWRRWHISLSTWLRDYVYIPLGGNRCSLPRNYANIIITMFLGGLWHGASWNFLLWGGIHGVALCLNHAWRSCRGYAKEETLRKKLSFSTIGAWLLTQGIVFLCWIPFRAATWSDTLYIGHQFFLGMTRFFYLFFTHKIPVLGPCSLPWALLILPVLIDTALHGNDRWRSRYSWASNTAFYVAISMALLLGLLFMSTGMVNFIYFQF
ncbi:MAG: MBOAT family O-acyltransferase [Chthoniobacterales bacterium]